MAVTPDDFHYDLDEKRIAQTPVSPRDAAKLMVIDRQTGDVSHYIFRDLADFLTNNDVLVINDSKVFPARLKGRKQSGGATEVLLLHPTGNDIWEAMSRGLKPGQIVQFGRELTGTVLSKNIETGHISIKLMSQSKSDELSVVIDRVGRIPVPPYIHSPLSETELRHEYQTVYANETGSAAAPTAGLHFTTELLESLQNNGVGVEHVTLHVGPGTFAKLLPENLATKTLHSEWYSVKPDAAARLNQAKLQGKRIIAVGTTAARTLESAVTLQKQVPQVQLGNAATNLFIMPPYRFRFVDSLITNLHLPESSLLMLVTAFISAPNTSASFRTFAESLMGKAYAKAIRSKYRFFSFGDAMWIR